MASEKHSKVTPLPAAPEKEPPLELERKDIPVLPVRDTVLFPHAVLPLTVGRESSIQLINSLGEEKTILVVAQREARVDSPQPSDLYSIGTGGRLDRRIGNGGKERRQSHKMSSLPMPRSIV